MPTYRRPIRIPASKLPLRLTVPRAVTARPSTKLSIRAKPRRFPDATSSAPITGPESLSLTLPVPPSINHQYASVNGRRLLSSTGRAYKAEVGQVVWLRLTNTANRSALLSRLQSGSLALSITFYFTSALRRDVDGGLKIAQDALCEGLGINDNRIVETHLYKQVDKTNPRIEVTLSTTVSPSRAL